MGASGAEPRVIGRYVLHAAVASGGMASVHLGRLVGPVGFARTVAVKRLHDPFANDPEFVSMFVGEARLASRIRHTNVVPTLDVVAADGELLLVMEYVHGETLARLIRAALRAERPVPPRVAVAILSGVLHGLHAAHEATDERGEPLGIVHRDVSPQNVIVGVDGVARVLDFGIAKAAGQTHTTRDGILKGKLAYMSPEQIRDLPLDRRSDVYAASVVLWETLTSRRLFSADNEGAVVEQLLSAPIVRPSELVPDIPRELDAVVMRGLVRDRGSRFTTAREMALALEEALAPATTAQVAEWVEKGAAEELENRAAIVARIEEDSASDPARPSTVLRQMGRAPGPRHEDVTARASPGARIEEEPTANAPVSKSTPASAGSRAVPVAVAIGLVAMLALGGGAILALRKTPRDHAATVPPSSATPVAPGARCDPHAPFGPATPVVVLGASNSTSARLTPDELTLYFQQIRAVCNDGGRCRDGYFLYYASRTSADGPFTSANGPKQFEVDTINESPSVDAANTILYFDAASAFVSGRPVHTLYYATRADSHSPFGPPAVYPGFNLNLAEAYVLPDSSYLYYVHISDVGCRIERAPISNGMLLAAEPLPGLGDCYTAPTPTPDQLTLYLQTKGADGRGHIAVTTRPAIDAPFGKPELVPELDLDGAHDTPTWISSDGCHLYFDREDPVSKKLGAYVAARPAR